MKFLLKLVKATTKLCDYVGLQQFGSHASFVIDINNFGKPKCHSNACINVVVEYYYSYPHQMR